MLNEGTGVPVVIIGTICTHAQFVQQTKPSRF
jgi:hypothetical protein